ncbi:MAG: BamA/TamA family outer membrane protein, partial [Bdellovibrionota bacterium]
HTLLTLQTTYSSKGPRDALIAFEKTGFAGTDLRFESEFAAFKNPYQNYFGLGDSTSYSRDLDSRGFNHYTIEGLVFSNSIRKHHDFGLDFVLGVTIPYKNLYSNGSNTLYFQEFGDRAVHHFSMRLEIGAIIDRRDSEFIPSRGYRASASLELAPAFLGSDSTFQRGELDFRFLVPLIENRWLLLANQIRYSECSPGAPITDHVKLGSSGTLRGLPYNRFLSNHSATLRSELRALFIRWHLFGMPLKGGTGIFADTGKIGDTFPRMLTRPFQAAWGITFFGSYFTDDFLGSADIGFSKDGMGIYIGLGHAI